MNVKQAAKEWKVSESSVRSYCNLGLISTCKKVDGEWVIEDDALCPYTKLAKAKKSTDYIYIVIINALRFKKTILCKSLEITEDDLLAYFDSLVKSELITKKPKGNNRDIFKNYIVSPNARGYLNNNKDFDSKAIEYIFSALSLVTNISALLI